MRVIAIDQGTTSTRAMLFEAGVAPRMVAALRHRQIYPHPGWVEHDPAELLSNVRGVLAGAGIADSIGLANQGESCLAWDAATLEPLSPIIVWQDQRAFDTVERLRSSGLGSEVWARAGLPLDCYFSASKLSWILENIPAAQRAERRGTLRLGTTDSFLIEHLTGVYATDVSTASRTSLMNLAALRWDTELCRAFGVPIEALAPILPTTGPFGAIEGIPLRASIVDQQAALYGHGCRNYGDAKITFGTGAFALALTGTVPAVTRSVGLIATVAWSNGRDTHYALEGGVYDAGAVIEWAQRIGLIDEVATLHSFNAPAAIARGPVFVPALSGLACPQWERRARGSWTQLSLETTRQDLQQSLLEGVALQTQTVLAAMEASIPLGQTLSVDGGLTESPYFLQFLADVVGKRIVRRESQELTAYGCALLAGYESSAADSGVPTVFDPAIAEHERARYIERYGAAAQSAVRLSATEKVALESASA